MQAFFDLRHGAVPTTGISGRAAYVGTALLGRHRKRRLGAAVFLLFRVRKHELEACTARLDRFVDQVAALRPGKRLRNREAEPGSLGALCRLLAPREPLEQLGHELRIDAAPAVLDREPEMPVLLFGLDSYWGIAVAKCVCDQVRDDPVEGVEIRDRLELARHDQLDRRRAVWNQRSDELLDAVPDANRLRPNPNRLRLQPREVEQLVDEPAQALALVVQGAPKIGDLLVIQFTPPQVQGRTDAVDDGGGRSQLVRGERDEVRLQLVEAAKLLLRECGLEERGHQRADRPQQLRGARVQLERLSAVIGGQEADAPVLAQQRQDEHAADAVGLRDPGRQTVLGGDVLDEDEVVRLQRSLEDPPVVEARRELPDLLGRDAVRGKQLELVRLRAEP